MTYRGRPGFEGRAGVKVYGELRGRGFGGPDRPVAAAYFEVIDTQRVGRDDDGTAVFDLGRRDGRFSAIRFAAVDGGIRIRSVRVTADFRPTTGRPSTLKVRFSAFGFGGLVFGLSQIGGAGLAETDPVAGPPALDPQSAGLRRETEGEAGNDVPSETPSDPEPELLSGHPLRPDPDAPRISPRGRPHNGAIDRGRPEDPSHTHI